eukprot:TRINITY_DN781_c0_g1_i11.p1 TRINITY_DN781_c0_g1~~TRINITY_DN781_c0_g1_i11.p1  ORF type:complete len:249 (-),score=35.42 TRINITY_DN781_c0_g1_i11:658-1404(-)
MNDSGNSEFCWASRPGSDRSRSRGAPRVSKDPRKPRRHCATATTRSKHGLPNSLVLPLCLAVMVSKWRMADRGRFESQTSNGASCPRDVITVVGNELIEAATPWRSRNFEIFQYRELLMEYYRRDPEMIWSAVPFPSLRDATFREGYEHTAGQRAEQMQKKEFVTHDWVEPTFDAADIIRCGKDVFVLHGHTCNLAGAAPPWAIPCCVLLVAPCHEVLQGSSGSKGSWAVEGSAHTCSTCPTCSTRAT